MYPIQSEEFKKYFLLEFTKQLIRNSIDLDIYKLINLIKQEENEVKEEGIKGKRKIKEFIRKKVKEDEEYSISVKKEVEEIPAFKTDYNKDVLKKSLPIRKPFFIQDPMLPERLQYIKPIPTGGEIELGKIDNFIQDPVVRIIECNGPNQAIVISGVMGKKETNVILTKEEIEKIIEKFSEETKIPLQEGFFKVALKKLVISAIYSKSIGSKFIIKKMLYAPQKNPFIIGNQNIHPSQQIR
jgi:hypothetical protein